MKIHQLATLGVALAGTLLLQTSLASAQDASSSPASNAASNGGDQREQFRQRMAERLKTALKATDEEWAVIQPLLEKVQTLQRQAGGGGRFGGGPGGWGGGGRRGQRNGGEQQGNNAGNGNANNNADRGPRGPRGGGPGGGTPEAQALRASLESDSTSPTEIKNELQALRDARAKATTELEQARADLKKVLNMRQEALLVLMGVLD